MILNPAKLFDNTKFSTKVNFHLKLQSFTNDLIFISKRNLLISNNNLYHLILQNYNENTVNVAKLLAVVELTLIMLTDIIKC